MQMMNVEKIYSGISNGLMGLGDWLKKNSDPIAFSVMLLGAFVFFGSGCALISLFLIVLAPTHVPVFAQVLCTGFFCASFALFTLMFLFKP